jgi:protein-S-isoprenylcysteine O-methyltransferase Ste14
MKSKGLTILHARVPETLSVLRLGMVAACLVLAFTLTTLFFLVVDRWLPEWMPDGEILVLALGFIVLSGFYTRRRVYVQTLADRSYREALLRFVIPGLGIVIGSIVHLAYMPGPAIPDLWWRPVLVGLGCVSLLVGGALWLRGVNELGLDRLTMLYVYFPEQTELVQSGGYGLLRHPIYAGALRIGTGLALVHANWYGLLMVPVLWVFFAGWIVLVEEKELVERCPDYPAYRRRVPAFCPRVHEVLRFVRYLVVGS